MQLTINRFGIQGAPTEVVMQHHNEEIKWNIALFDKMNSVDKEGFEDQYNIFEQINQYWEYIPAHDQSKIFDCYKRIRFVFDNVWDTSILTRELYSLINELCSYHDLDQIQQWILYHTTIIIPDTFQEVYPASYETTTTREKTYLKSDYLGLLSLSVGLRIMIPIWGEFVSRTRKETGTNLKEYYAFKLLSNSPFMYSEPMERLKIYVEHSIPPDKSRSGAIITAISSEDYPLWMLSLIVVRRLSIGDVRGIIPGSTLVTYIYKFINGKIKGHDNSFNGKITDKVIDGQGSDSENNLSKLEGYKIKQEIPAGDIAILEFYIGNPVQVAKTICPNINTDLVLKCVEICRKNMNYPIHEAQVMLIQWVLSKAVSPRGILHLNKNLCLTAMGIAQACLWHKEHYCLGALISAIEFDNADEMSLGGSESRARITRAQIDELNKYFPYIRKPFGKQRIQKPINPAQESVDLLASKLNKNWRLMIDDEMIEQIPGGAQRIFVIPYDIKIQIAKLAIALADRTFYRGEINVSATTVI